LIDKISVEPSKGEKIFFKHSSRNDRVYLVVQLTPAIVEELELNLVRYEFLSRVASEGALPASFSKECYEDILAFKSRLIAAQMKRQYAEGPKAGNTIELKILSLSDHGDPKDHFVDVMP
jgi:hypothetical protein